MTTTALPVQATGEVDRGIRRIFIANLIAQSAIVVTGAIVRITASGLGCPTWPECTPGSLVPTAEQVESWQKFVEFGNRLLTFVLAALAIAAVVGILIQRRRWRARGLPSRRALLLLALVPLIGTIVQAVLGGITVLTGLHPATVSAHFLVSMGIIAACVALVARSGDAGDGPIIRATPALVRGLAFALVAVAAVVVFLGVLVTGTGPHSGDVGVDARFGFDFRLISWLHADAVLLFLGLLAGLIVALAILGRPQPGFRRAIGLLVIALVQGAVGYTQFFTGLPEILVIIHVVGAVLVWNFVLFIPFGLRVRLISQGTDQPQLQGRAAPNT
jgi:cytochrome c oxidase assembly protein subunit 15